MYFLGSITGASGAYSNVQTGVSGIGTFAIPAGAKSLYLVASASGLKFELGGASGFQTTALRGAPLAGPDVLNGPFRVPAGAPGTIVSIFNSAGGFISCRVYSSPTSS